MTTPPQGTPVPPKNATTPPGGSPSASSGGSGGASGSAPPKPRRRIWRWIRRLLLGSLILVLLVVVLVAAVIAYLLGTEGGRARVASIVEGIVSEQVLVGDLTIERIDSLWPGTLEVSGVVVTDAESREAVALGRVAVAYQIRPLLEQHVVVDRIEIEGLDVDARIGADGGLNLAELVPPSEPSPPSDAPGWRIDLPDVSVRDTRFVMRDGRNDDARLVVVEDLALQVAFAMDPDGAMDVVLPTLTAQVAPPTDLDARLGMSIEDLTLTMDAAELRATLTRVAFDETAMTDLQASMAFDPTGARAFERLHVEFPDLLIDPADAEQFVSDVTLRDPVRVEASIDGPPEALTASVVASSGGALIDVALELDITDPATPGYLGTIELARFRPAKWIVMDGLDVDVSALIVVDGTGITPQDARGRIRIDAGPSRVMGQGIEGAFVSAAFAWGEVQLRALEVWADGVTLEANGSGDLKGRVEAEVNLRIADIDRVRRRAMLKMSTAGSVEVDLEVRGTASPEALADLDTSDPLALVDEWLPRFQARLDVRADGIDVDGQRVGRLELGVAVPESDVAAVDVDLDVRAVRLPGVVRLRSAEVAAELRDRDVDVSLSVVEEPPESRTIEADLSLAWRDPDVQLAIERLVVEASPVLAELRRPLRATATLDEAFAPVRASVDPFTVALNDTPIDLSGSWASTGAIRGEIATGVVDLSAISRILEGLPELSGTAEVSARVRGTLARPEGDVTLSLRDVAMDPIRDLDLDTAVVYAGRRLRLGLDASLQGDPLISVSTGQVGVPLVVDLERGVFDVPTSEAFELHAELHRVDLGDARRFVPDLESMGVRGSATANIDVDGTLDDPDARVAVRLDRLGASVPLGEDVVELSEVGLVLAGKYGGEEGGVTGSLQLAAFGRDVLEVRLSSEADVRPILDGEVSAEEWLADLRGEINAVLGPIEVADLPEAVQRMLPVTSGRFDATARMAGGVAGGEMDATLVARQLVMDGAPEVSTVIDVHAGEATTVDVRLALGDDRPIDVWRDGGTFEGQAELIADRADAAAVHLYAEHRQGLRELLASGPDFDAEIATRLHVPGLPLSLVAPAEGDDPPMAGRVRGYVDITGTVLDPRVQGRWTLRDLPLADGSDGLFAVELAYDDQRFDASARVCSGGTQSVYATAATYLPNPLLARDGTVMIPDVTRLPLDVDVDATDAALAAVLPTAIAGGLVEDPLGTLDLQLRLDGTLVAPMFDGSLAVRDAEMGVVPIGRRFEDMTLLATFSNEAVEIETLELYDGASRVRGSGQVELEDLLPSGIELDLRLRDFLLADPTGAGVYVDGRIGVDGARSGEVLVTNVTLRGLEVSVPPSAVASGAGPTTATGNVLFIGEDVDRSQVGLAEPVRLDADDVAAATPAMAMDVHVVTAGRNTIEGDVTGTRFEIVFETDLDVRLRDEGMRIGGQVLLPEGQVTVLSKPFELTRGYITFNNELNVIDPVIDIRADYFLSADVAANLEPPSGERASVFLVVDGPLSGISGEDGRIAEFQSDPQLPFQDIISVLINGRPRDDSSGEGDSQALAAAGSLLLGLLGNQIAGGAGIDTLRIESDAEAEGSIARVEGGKYISPDFYVSGAYIYDGEPGFELRLEWIIARFRSASLRATLAGTTLRTGAIEMLYQFTRPGRTRAAPDPIEE